MYLAMGCSAKVAEMAANKKAQKESFAAAQAEQRDSRLGNTKKRSKARRFIDAMNPFAVCTADQDCVVSPRGVGGKRRNSQKVPYSCDFFMSLSILEEDFKIDPPFTPSNEPLTSALHYQRGSFLDISNNANEKDYGIFFDGDLDEDLDRITDLPQPSPKGSSVPGGAHNSFVGLAGSGSLGSAGTSKHHNLCGSS